MNFQQEKQLAGASPRTWLSSTDKMCTTDSLAGFNLHSISAPAVQFQLILVVLEFSFFAGPAEDEFTCYSWDLQHLNIITDFTHIYI